ncbi:MAG: phage protein Gp27 family protein [Planctomycetota bacterium]|nr:phage protein Gp27 family protein [Planctomycetota bacterium]
MARRTHSTIDKLPGDVRETITRMVTDGLWPDGFGGAAAREGKPTYDDVVRYCQIHGHDISHSAVGRWAKQLLVYERMQLSRQIARQVMTGIDDEHTATEVQKAAAEIMTARIIDLIVDTDMNARDIQQVSGAIRDMTQSTLNADKYIRARDAERAKAAADRTGKTLKDAGVDRAKVQEIIDDILGITS